MRRTDDGDLGWRQLHVASGGVFVVALGSHLAFNRPYVETLSDELLLIAQATVIAGLLLAGTFLRPLRGLRLPTGAVARAAVGGLVVAAAAYAYWIRPDPALAATLGLTAISLPPAIDAWLAGLEDSSMAETRVYALVDLARYVSPLMIWLALLGWLVSAWAAIRERAGIGLWVPLGLCFGWCVLYAWNPAVDPIHLWASRRAIPVVIPAITLFGFLGLLWIVRRTRPVVATVAASGVFAYLCIFLVDANATFVTWKENAGAFAQLAAVARGLPEDELILATAPPHSPLWTLPLQLAFGRRVAPLDMGGPEAARVLRRYQAATFERGEPLHVLTHEEWRFPGFTVTDTQDFRLSWPHSERVRRPLPRRTVAEHVRLRVHRLLPGVAPDLRGTDLLSVWDWRVSRTGFFEQEFDPRGAARWTGPRATLGVRLDARRPARALHVSLAAFRAPDTRLQIRVNDQRVIDTTLPPGPWDRTIELDGIPVRQDLTVELHSSTFQPADRLAGSTDPRRLGVRVRGIVLLGHDAER